MLVSSIEDFVKYIPTAAGTTWDAIATFMYDADAEMELMSFGTNAMSALKALSADNDIRKIANKIHCLLGYHHSIPFTDLIQTKTGFAVTNTGNMAPASKERVERLIAWCDDQINTLMDLLTESIRMNSNLLSEWKKFSGYPQIFDCLFVTGIDFARSAQVEGNKRTVFLKEKPNLVSIQNNVLAPVVSKKYLAELISMVSNNNITTDAAPVITLCKQVLGQIFIKNNDNALKTLNEISNLLESDTTKYSTYVSSPEYTLRHSANYENKQEDSTYFFGM